LVKKTEDSEDAEAQKVLLEEVVILEIAEEDQTDQKDLAEVLVKEALVDSEENVEKVKSLFYI
jgi:hypothetical protein